MHSLDLLLVNPGDRRKLYSDLDSLLPAIEPPLLVGLIAAFIREQGFSVGIIDADAEGWSAEYTVGKIIEQGALLVGIAALGATPTASSTPKMSAAGKILNILKDRAPHLKTFLFGIHPSALAEKTLREESVDFICRGECFYTALRVLEILKSRKQIDDFAIAGLCYRKGNKIILNGWGELVRNLDELPFAAWDLLPMDKYRAHNWHCFENLEQRQPYAVIYTSLGCPFNCTYCNVHALYSGKPGIRFRSPKRVVEEIDFLVKNYKIRNLKILDELFVLNLSHVLEFCDLIIQRKYDLNMWAYARVDTVNEILLKKMKQAGIKWLCYGIESGNKRVRAAVVKGQFGQDRINKVVEMTHQAGIDVIGNFMFGLPEDNLQTMQETLNMAKELNCEYANFYCLMSYPGSRLNEDAVEQGMELPDNWLGYSQLSRETLPLAGKYLSSAEILRFRDQAFAEYYSNPQYIEMIKNKFGHKAVEHVKEMLKYKIHRKLLEPGRG